MVSEPVHVVLALANLMDVNAVLNEESKARVNLAAEVFINSGADKIMFIGWDYRPDSDIAICDAMANYCLEKTKIHEDKIIVNPNSRDTVGDAIFSRLQLSNLFSGFKLSVVSTDYHTPRVKVIFETVYGSDYDINILSSKSEYMAEKNLSEQSSLSAFEKTFKTINPGDLNGFKERLISSHPFYNGEVFPDAPVSAGAMIA